MIEIPKFDLEQTEIKCVSELIVFEKHSIKISFNYTTEFSLVINVFSHFNTQVVGSVYGEMKE